jgi:hypothetical protein
MEARRAHQSGNVEKQEPDQKHRSQQSCGPAVHRSDSDAEAGCDKGRARKVRPEEASRKPRRSEAGDRVEDEEVIDAKHDGETANR